LDFYLQVEKMPAMEVAAWKKKYEKWIHKLHKCVQWLCDSKDNKGR
jgi:hypothetical protein